MPDTTYKAGPLDVDSTSNAVVRIRYAGGPGGDGGDGGRADIEAALGVGTGGGGGPGGRGGDAATLTVQLSAAGQPQQLIIDVSPAPGGRGGIGEDGGAGGPAGDPGKGGTVTFEETS
jgi:hypothetical protein